MRRTARNCRWGLVAIRLPLGAAPLAILAAAALASAAPPPDAPLPNGALQSGRPAEATGAAEGRAAAGDPLAAGLAMLSAGKYAEAADVLAAVVAEQELAAAPTAAELERSVRAMIGAGQSLRHLGKHPEALEFFEAAIDLQAEDAHRGAAGGPLDPLRLAAADCALRSGALDLAAAHCAAVLESTDQPPLRTAAERIAVRVKNEQGQCGEAWQRLEEICRAEEVDRQEWSEVALAIGLRALTERQPKTAAAACRWFLEHAPADADRESAVLGVAWAAAQGADDRARAAELLLDFVAEFPESPNVPRALLVAAGCLQRVDQPEQASEVLQRLIGEHPRSPEAAAAIGQLAELAPGASLPEAVLENIRQLLASGETVADETLVAAIVASSGGADPELWQAATNALLKTPSSRGKVGHVLTMLTDQAEHADAERLAAIVLGGADGEVVEPAFEQAARWAAIHGRWSMLALAAEYMDAGEDGESGGRDPRWERFSPLSLRLLAEGLVQVGRGREARPLLDRLVEVHQVTDFDVFVRRAEIALASDPRAAARAAVEQANAAVTTAAEQTLADILQAQLLIREARMDEARVLLEGVVRDGPTADEIKARAQWLIGETHFLQRRYREAVEAYRVVETFDDQRQGDQVPGGRPEGQAHWTAAALVQAGKAFEQLGRPRDAAFCYSGLLRRFGDSPHAAAARDRLAAIGRSTELR